MKNDPFIIHSRLSIFIITDLWKTRNMDKLGARINAFFLGNRSWMHFTVILFLSYVFTQIGHRLEMGVFFFWASALTLVFSMPLLYTYFLPDLKEKFSKTVLALLWTLCFIIVPGIFLLTNSTISAFDFLQQYDSKLNEANTPAIGIAAFVFLIVELMHFGFAWLGNRFDFSSWLINLKGKKIALLLLILFSLLVPLFSNVFQNMIAEQSITSSIISYVGFVVQTFVAYSMYYFLYYVHHYLLFKRLLKERGMLYYIIGLVGFLIIFTITSNFLISLLPGTKQLQIHTTALEVPLLSDINFQIPILVAILSFPIILIIEWYKKANTISALEQAKAEAELSLLKEQINPHFFFNTLNNLYAMSLTNDSETPETILKLSELMRYVIYKGKNEKVLLSEEVEYLQDYVHLQNIRIQKDLDYSFDVNVDEASYMISPLLFIIFIENAFKHGIEPAEEACYLHIKLECKKGKLTFSCENSKPDFISSYAKGIGLTNLQRRLDIIYPDSYKLNINEDKDSYRAELNINL